MMTDMDFYGHVFWVQNIMHAGIVCYKDSKKMTY